MWKKNYIHIYLGLATYLRLSIVGAPVRVIVSFHFDSPEHPEVSAQFSEGFPRQERPRRWLFGNHKDPCVLVALSRQRLEHVCLCARLCV